MSHNRSSNAIAVPQPRRPSKVLLTDQRTGFLILFYFLAFGFGAICVGISLSDAPVMLKTLVWVPGALLSGLWVWLVYNRLRHGNVLTLTTETLSFPRHFGFREIRWADIDGFAILGSKKCQIRGHVAMLPQPKLLSMAELAERLGMIQKILRQSGTATAQEGHVFSPAPSLVEEHVEDLFEGDDVRIERIVSLGHKSPAEGWYDQDGDEWVLLLRGGARIELESRDDALQLTPGDWVLLPRGCRHRVVWTDPDAETYWLAVHMTSR